MIDEKKLEEMKAGIRRGAYATTVGEQVELIRLAHLALHWQRAVDSENGKANLLYLLDLGRWAKHHGIPALKQSHETLSFVVHTAGGYDWNTDVLSLTLKSGEAFKSAYDAIAALPKGER